MGGHRIVIDALKITTVVALFVVLVTRHDLVCFCYTFTLSTLAVVLV